jgi:hypothetical protein
MPFPSDNPVIVPPQPERDYSKWWMVRFSVNGMDPNGTTSITAGFVRVTDKDENGVRYVMPGSYREHTIEDLFAMAASDPAVASLMDSIVLMAGTVAKAAGKID